MQSLLRVGESLPLFPRPLRTMDEMPSSSSSWIRFTGFRSCCRDLLCRDSWKRDSDTQVSTAMSSS